MTKKRCENVESKHGCEGGLYGSKASPCLSETILQFSILKNIHFHFKVSLLFKACDWVASGSHILAEAFTG